MPDKEQMIKKFLVLDMRVRDERSRKRMATDTTAQKNRRGASLAAREGGLHPQCSKRPAAL